LKDCFFGRYEDTCSSNAELIILQKIFKLTGLKRNEIFLDLGHGIGNAPIQAAATIGCESRGLELVKNRFSLSSAIQRKFCTLLKNREKEAQKVG
jgi:cyclopropane fatty-acyl-phospholipid synthase-like methyltransferase